MLRLERRSHQEVSIAFGPGRSFWSRSLLIAFAIAIGLHLFGFLLFRFKEFFHKGDRILLPTEVEIDLSKGFNAFVAFEKQRQNRYPFEPAPSTLKLPDMPLHGWKDDWDHLAFLEEKRAVKNTVRINPFGELANMSIIGGLSLEISKNALPDQYAIYAVQVDSGSGQVFWWMRQEASEAYILDLEAESILRHLRFQPNAAHDVVSGYIEIRYLALTGGD